MTEVASSNVNTGASDGSGRVRIVTEPALPATCAICVRSANGQIRFIDFNADLDYYGAIVICEDCMRESLTLLGFTDEINFTNKVSELEKKQQELEVAQNELDKYRTIVNGLRDVGLTNLPDDIEPEGSDETSGDSEQTDGERLETESDSDGSDSVGGLKNISIFAD